MATPRTRKTSARRQRRALTAGGKTPASGQLQPTAGDVSVVRRIFWTLDRRRVELAPLAVSGALFGTSAAFYLGGTPVMGLVVGGAIAGCTWGLAHKRLDRPAEVTYARTVATSAATYLAAASIAGPADPIMFWGLTLATSVLSWPWYRHKLARPTAPNLLAAEWAARWEAIRDELGAADSRVVDATGDESYAEVTIRLAHGQTYADFKDNAERVASLLGEPARAIKLRSQRKISADLITLVYTKVSSIDKVITWDELAAIAPARLRDPAPIARREDGEIKTVDVRGHWMIVGMSRAGKSNELHTLLATVTGTFDPADPEAKAEALVFFIDLKGGSVGGRWVECVDWLATTMDEAIRVAEAVNAMIDARAQSAPVGDGDGDQVENSAEMPAVFVVFDECAEGIGEAPGRPGQADRTLLTGLMESIARRGAAMGFYLVLCGQDGSLETYGTEKLRGNLMKRMCFRVARRDNAQYVLDGYTNLEVKALESGQFYYHERADDPVPMRGPWMTPPDNPRLPQQIAARHGARRPTLEPEVAAAGGVDYATRWDRLPTKYRKITQSAGNVPAQTQEVQQMRESTPRPGSPEARVAELERAAGIGDGPAVTAEDLQRAAAHGPLDVAAEVEDTEMALCVLLVQAPAGGHKAKAIMDMLGIGKTYLYDRTTTWKGLGLVEQPSVGHWRAAPGVGARDLKLALDRQDSERRELAGAHA